MYFFFFSAYFMVLMISSTSELISCFNEDGIVEGSCFYSSMVFLMWTLVIACVKWQFFKSQYNFTFTRMVYFRICFNGLRLKWHARAYALSVFLRKYLLVLVSIGLFTVDAEYRLPLYISVQVLYLLSICVTFPFSDLKDNIIVISTEFVYTILSILIVRCHSNNGLSKAVESTFLYLVLATVIWGLTVSIGNYFKSNFIGALAFKIFKKFLWDKVKSKIQHGKSKYRSTNRMETQKKLELNLDEFSDQPYSIDISKYNKDLLKDNSYKISTPKIGKQQYLVPVLLD